MQGEHKDGKTKDKKEKCHNICPFHLLSQWAATANSVIPHKIHA